MRASDYRDSTISAMAVAAFRNLQICVVRWGCKNTFVAQFVLVFLAQILKQICPVKLTVELVNLRDFLLQFLEISF